MSGFFIATRNIIIAVLLGWIGMAFTSTEQEQEEIQDQQETASILDFS